MDGELVADIMTRSLIYSLVALILGQHCSMLLKH